MKYAGIMGIIAGCAFLGGSAFKVHAEVRASAERLKTGVVLAEKPAVAIANHAEASYCTPKFKEVLARVIHACGLDGGDSRRGCQPADVKTLASINDDDFNNLFTPLKDRGGVVMFDDASEKLDDDGKRMIEDLWLDRKGARYFFILARASKTGGRTSIDRFRTSVRTARSFTSVTNSKNRTSTNRSVCCGSETNSLSLVRTTANGMFLGKTSRAPPKRSIGVPSSRGSTVSFDACAMGHGV